MTRGSSRSRREELYEEEKEFDEEDMTAIGGEFRTDGGSKKKGTVTADKEDKEGSGSAHEISNIIKKIRDNDYNRDKKEYLKRKNKEYQKMKASSNAMHLNGAFHGKEKPDEEVKGGKIDKRQKKNLKEKAMAKELSKTKKSGS